MDSKKEVHRLLLRDFSGGSLISKEGKQHLLVTLREFEELDESSWEAVSFRCPVLITTVFIVMLTAMCTPYEFPLSLTA